MNAGLAGVSDALAGLTDTELHALTVAANEAAQIASPLLVWIAGACDWELNRRRGYDYRLLPPEAVVDPSEDAVSIDAIGAMRRSFAAGEMAPAVHRLFDALAVLFTGGERYH